MDAYARTSGEYEPFYSPIRLVSGEQRGESVPISINLDAIALVVHRCRMEVWHVWRGTGGAESPYMASIYPRSSGRDVPRAVRRHDGPLLCRQSPAEFFDLDVL